MSNPIYYQGQQVGCLMYGEGVVLEINSNYVCVQVDGGTEEFYHNGRYMKHSRPTLYPIDQYREIIANIPAPQPEAWKPKPGEWCWFWDQCDEKESAVLRKFKHSSNYRYTDEKGVDWQNCTPFVGELPEHLKEVQP